MSLYLFCLIIAAAAAVPAGLNSSSSEVGFGKFEKKRWGGEVTPPGECGRLYECASGHVLYRPFGSLVPNTRCTFLISVPGANLYQLVVSFAGFLEPSKQFHPHGNKTNAGLIITPLSYDEDSLASYALTEVNTPIELNAQSVLLTFYTTHSVGGNGGGFILSYEASSRGLNKPISPRSENVFIAGDGSPHRHPTKLGQLGPELQPREQSALVFPPQGAQLVSGTRMTIHYTRTTPSEDVGCGFQRLVYFVLNLEANLGYALKGEICEDKDLSQMIFSDVALLIVKSTRKATDVKRGFEVVFKG